MAEIKVLALDKLLLNMGNPRYETQPNQITALWTIAKEQGEKLAKLVEDIAEKGFDPSQNLIVAPERKGKYTVLEGNRRIAAAKFLVSPSLIKSMDLPQKLKTRVIEANEKYKDSLPKEIQASVMTPEEARHWIYLRHTGENDGIGAVQWDGIQTERYRGNSPELQVVDLVKASPYIDQNTREKLAKLAITNLSRLLNTPEVRDELGIDIQDGQLVFTTKEEEAIARLSLVVKDIAQKTITVSNIRTKDQRVKYAEDIAALPLPQPALSGPTDDAKRNAVKDPKKKKKPTKKQGANRTTLIPPALNMVIGQPRISRIYLELTRLNLGRFENSVAVLLRVFLELSLIEYAKENGLTLRKPAQKGGKTLDKDMTLREKIRLIADHLETTGKCSRGELQGIRKLAAEKHHVLSIDSLHGYVHNPDYNPAADELKKTWDNIESFMEGIWASE